MVSYITCEAEKHLRQSLFSNPEEYEAVRGKTDPPTMVEWVERYTPALFSDAGKQFLPGIIDNPRIGTDIIRMRWWTVEAPRGSDLLTSDNPVFRSHALDERQCLIALPLSPHFIFFATRHPETLNAVLTHGPDIVRKQLNA